MKEYLIEMYKFLPRRVSALLYLIIYSPILLAEPDGSVSGISFVRSMSK